MDVQKPLNAQVLETNWDLFTNSRIVSLFGFVLVSLQITIFGISVWAVNSSNPNFTTVSAMEVLTYIATFMSLIYFAVAIQTWSSYNVKGPQLWIVAFFVITILLLVSVSVFRSRLGATQISSPLAGSRPIVPPALPGTSTASWNTFNTLTFAFATTEVAILLILVLLETRPLLLALDNIPRIVGLE